MILAQRTLSIYRMTVDSFKYIKSKCLSFLDIIAQIFFTYIIIFNKLKNKLFRYIFVMRWRENDDDMWYVSEQHLSLVFDIKHFSVYFWYTPPNIVVVAAVAVLTLKLYISKMNLDEHFLILYLNLTFLFSMGMMNDEYLPKDLILTFLKA